MSNVTTSVIYGSTVVDGLTIAYREAGDPANPKLVLLHGFPSSSHQYRDLIRALADRFHLIAPDYPGFGGSDTPDPVTFPYTFDHIAQVIERFLTLKGFVRYGLYVQDYGGPIGFRLIDSKPNALEWLIVQNSNAYEVGFSAAWAGLRALWAKRSHETEEPLLGIRNGCLLRERLRRGNQVRAGNRVIDGSLSTDARKFRGDRCPVHAGPENQQRNEDGNRGKAKPDPRRRVDLAVAALVPDEQRNE